MFSSALPSKSTTSLVKLHKKKLKVDGWIMNDDDDDDQHTYLFIWLVYKVEEQF